MCTAHIWFDVLPYTFAQISPSRARTFPDNLKETIGKLGHNSFLGTTHYTDLATESGPDDDAEDYDPMDTTP